jgi:hypothetical protein
MGFQKESPSAISPGTKNFAASREVILFRVTTAGGESSDGDESQIAARPLGGATFSVERSTRLILVTETVQA